MTWQEISGGMIVGDVPITENEDITTSWRERNETTGPVRWRDVVGMFPFFSSHLANAMQIMLSSRLFAYQNTVAVPISQRVSLMCNVHSGEFSCS